jgi:hypothetical protein
MEARWRSEVVELLACSKRGLCDLCVENGLNPKGNKNILLMRLLDHKAAAGTGTRRPLLLGLGVECLGLVFKSMMREEVDDDVGPVGDWRRQVVALSKLTKVCTMFRDAARLLIDPILSRGSIRDLDWPARQQMPLIQSMCAKRQVLRELSLTLVDEAELPLLLLLVLKCDVSALTSLKLISHMGDPKLYWMRIKKGRPEPIAIWDDSVSIWDEHENRTKTSYSFFSNMASSLGVSLPSPDFFQDVYAIAGNWAGKGRVTFQGRFPRQFLTMSLSHCPALAHLDMTGFRLDKNFFNALPGCRHLKTLKVAEIPGGTSVEPWKGHGLTTLTLSRHFPSRSGLHKLLPILQSLTSLNIDASAREFRNTGDSDEDSDGDSDEDSDGSESEVAKLKLQSNSLCRFAIHRKCGHYKGEVFDFPNLRAFRFVTGFPMPPFPDTRSGCKVVAFLNSYPLLEEYRVESSYFEDSSKQAIRIPPGRPMATETLLIKKMRGFRYVPGRKMSLQRLHKGTIVRMALDCSTSTGPHFALLTCVTYTLVGFRSPYNILYISSRRVVHAPTSTTEALAEGKASDKIDEVFVCLFVQNESPDADF